MVSLKIFCLFAFFALFLVTLSYSLPASPDLTESQDLEFDGVEGSLRRTTSYFNLHETDTDSILSEESLELDEIVLNPFNQTECSICMDSLSDSKVLGVTKPYNEYECGHIFHVQCIRTWQRMANNACPFCRSPKVIPDAFKGYEFLLSIH